jgi:hypothetical protein
MFKLCDYQVEKQDFITSDKFLCIIEHLNNNKIRYIKTDFLKNRNGPFISMRTWRDINRNINLNDVSILITGHSDYPIDIRELDILNNPKLKLFFCQNKNIRHHKLFSLPIGITNINEPNSIVHKIIGNTDAIYEISRTPKNIKNLVYLNITPENYPSERLKIINSYKDESWVTYEKPIISIGGHYNFLKNIYEHKFVFAPRGGGIDTHRQWESLYLRTIPIVKKCIGMEDFYDLPILFVDDWDDLSEEYLNSKYDEIMEKDYNLDKLKINYWIDLIFSKINEE